KKLLRGSSWRAAKQRRAIPTAPLDEGNNSDLPGPVHSIISMAMCAGLNVAEVALSHGVEENVARAIADGVTSKMVHAASDLLEEDFNPPEGCECWADHMASRVPSHRSDIEWAAMVADV